MRSALLSFSLLFSTFACGASSDPDAPAPLTDDAPLPPPRAADKTPTIPAPPATSPVPSTTKDIAGTVTDNSGNAIPDASIAVIDANGKKTVATTDATGAFDVRAVVTPYDIRVTTGYPLVFFGVTTSSPKIRHAGAPSSSPYASRKATIFTAVDLPSCPTPSCVAHLWSGSKTGGFGRKSMSFSGAAHRSETVEIEHAWTNNSTTDSVDVDVVLVDSSFKTYWHQKVDTNVLVLENQAVVLYAAAPKPVATVGPIPIELDAPNVPADWRKHGQVLLSVPGQHVPFAMQGITTGSAVTYLPNLPGATFQVSAWGNAEELFDAEWTLLHDQKTYVDTGALPVTTSPVDVELAKGPSISSPGLLGALSIKTGKFEWQSIPGRVVTFRVVDLVTKKLVFWATAASNAVSLASVQKLDIAVEPQRHSLRFWSFPGQSAEDAMEDRFGAGRSLTDESLVFDVVP